ncbi:lytic murein transglycosylase [Breoghania sp.]|uniref:lytic murein transglycosylase n=1 Tax=Breoghania sp. TaxID=2065378 RepID=UPI0029C9FE98|nr:lytic murein transglycosylase [Breoghania sp.]
MMFRLPLTVMTGTLLLLVVSFAPTAQAAVNKRAVEQTFRTWIEKDLWPKAASRKVSRATFRDATRSLRLQWKLPDLMPPGASKAAPRRQRQSEFRSPARYFSEGNLNTLVALGRDRMERWKDTLSRIEARYGVPAHVIVAIWGRETGYSRAKLPHNALEVLATQAFMGRRKAIFMEETLAALVILEEDHFPGAALQSSWAGALGGPQFLPSKFLQYAVDFDGDGKRDIWNSTPDTLASIANYLKQHGWRTGRDWGFEAEIPSTISCKQEGPEQGRPISAWVAAGAKRVSGRPFPPHEIGQIGYLLMPAGRFGPAFISTPNFFVLKAYNESDAYALFIGHLGDRLAYTNKPLVAGWRDPGDFARRAVQKMQERLEGAGYDVGGADGLVGFKTRTAIGAWQERNGLPPTCYPDENLLARFR